MARKIKFDTDDHQAAVETANESAIAVAGDGQPVVTHDRREGDVDQQQDQDQDYGDDEAGDVADPVPTVTKITAGLEVDFPLRFQSGHVLTGLEATVFGAILLGQFINLKNGQHKAYLARVAKGEAISRPYGLVYDDIVAEWATYLPAVGSRSGGTDPEALRAEAAWLVVKDLFSEHNLAVQATGHGPYGAKLVQLPENRGRVSADAKAANAAAKAKYIHQILTSPKHADRLSAKLQVLQAPKLSAPVTKVEAVDEL
jgi:hypothetical protein